MTIPVEAKLTAARVAVADALECARFAFLDQQGFLGIQRLPDTESVEFRARAKFRVAVAAVAFQRIEYAVARLARRGGVDLEDVQTQSPAIRLVGRLANTWKHGLGGQSQNATIPEGILAVHRGDGFKDEQGNERVHVIGFAVVDASEGVFNSQDLFRVCATDWGTLLTDAVPDALAWSRAIAPPSAAPIVDLSRKTHDVVPVGSTVRFTFPDDVDRMLKDEISRRVASA